MTEKLKPCPFCGGKATIRKVLSVSGSLASSATGYGGYFAMCCYCMTTSNNYSTAEICAEHWNRRVNDE